LNASWTSQKNNYSATKKENKMTTTDFTTGFTVDQSPKEVYNAINNVRGWWSENIEGSTDKLNAEWTYSQKDLHKCKMKIVEMVPEKKVVWLVMENYFHFTKDKSEWTGNKIVFDITEKDGRTHVQFTQVGLNPEYECYDVCHDAWTGFIQKSLHDLIVTGKGQPNPKEGLNQINADNIKKHNLNSN
jgi:hypothetical protein